MDLCILEGTERTNVKYEETWLFFFLFKLFYFFLKKSLVVFFFFSFSHICGTLVIWNNLHLEYFGLGKMEWHNFLSQSSDTNWALAKGLKQQM